jgi:hypothetical protein
MFFKTFLLYSTVVLSSLFSTSHSAKASEAYFLGGQQDNLEGYRSLLTLSVTGTVQGIMDGKIALDPSGDISEKCGASTREAKPASPPILMLKLWDEGPPLLKFTLSSR